MAKLVSSMEAMQEKIKVLEEHVDALQVVNKKALEKLEASRKKSRVKSSCFSFARKKPEAEETSQSKAGAAEGKKAGMSRFSLRQKRKDAPADTPAAEAGGSGQQAPACGHEEGAQTVSSKPSAYGV